MTEAARPWLLQMRDLTVAYPERDGRLHAVVRGVSLCMGRERVALVGESGSGKSQTGRAILGLNGPAARVQAVCLNFEGQDLLQCSAAERRSLRGARMAMVLQDPKTALNPVLRVGAQIAESLHAHERLSRAQARQRTLQALQSVQIDDPERVAALYPHQISGGMGQRVMLAMMLIAQPSLLVADEPTSALDVSVQLDILALLDRLVRERGMGLLFISHDLRLVQRFCDRVLVMYAGRVLEELAARDLEQARHPYTRALLECLPRLDAPRARLAVMQRDAQWAA